MELVVANLLESHGFSVIKKGKQIDIIALSAKSILFIECKYYNSYISGKTLTKIRRKLNSSVAKLLQDPLISSLAQGKQIFKILLTVNSVKIRNGDILTFTLEQFENFLRR